MNEITAYLHGTEDTQAELARVTAQRDGLLAAAELALGLVKSLNEDGIKYGEGPDMYSYEEKELQTAIAACQED